MITKMELNKVKYNELQKKFKELNIPDVWKAGEKKEVLINAALDRLEHLRKKALADEALTKSDLKKVEEKKKEIPEQYKGIDKVLKEKNRLKKLSFTKDNILNTIKNIDANLNNSPSDAKRRMLLDKRIILEEVLKDYD